MAGYLPEEIIEKVLLRLPVKTLIRFTTVCKSWLSKIKASTFVQSHLCTTIDSNNQNDAHLLLLSARSYSKERICYEHHWLHWDSPEFGEYSKLSNPLSFFTPKKKPQELRGTGTCNGLTVKLPRIPGWGHPNDYKVYRMYAPLGFGYDPHSNDYKVLRIVILRSDWFSFRYSSVVQVYSLARGSWRRLSASVAPLDLQASESWTYLFNVPVDHTDIYGFRRCGEVVLKEEKDGGQSRMVFFDPKSGNQVKVIGSEDHVYCFMDSFVESLVLLDHANAISTK
uniref:F-box protein CPR30-like n=1 Tax=Fragaria vesca subsp. vesca TaxID=101020 RepID=UPI0005CA900C|nr:PREDICTED: F-box protein CPR30-like [Fragaria vesca subsp. vesca]